MLNPQSETKSLPELRPASRQGLERDRLGDEFPLVTAIIPSRNEYGYINRCLESMVTCDYPKDRLEVIVTDGMSDDGTRSVVERFCRDYPWIRLLDNPKRILASAWNVGIKAARGDIVVALNAHGVFNPSYISTCVRHLRSDSHIDCVGGVVKAVPKHDTLSGRSICIVLSHPFGVGNSHFRTGSSAPRIADTVAFGGYWRKLFDRLGFFNEELIRSQDMELHRRLDDAGCRILLDPSMYCHYYTRSSFIEFLRYSFINGFWITYPLRFSAVAIRLRHVVPLFFVLSIVALGLLSTALPSMTLPGTSLPTFLCLLGSIATLYIISMMYASCTAAFANKDFRYALTLPVLFLTLHVTYGLGSFVGLCCATASRRFWANLHSLCFASSKLNDVQQGLH